MRDASNDPALHVRVRARHALAYAEGADPLLDRPGHVRAGSALAWVGARLAVVQDDANFVALIDPASLGAGPGAAGEGARVHVRALTLPAGEGGLRQFDAARGNKKHKLDLEACVALSSDEARAIDRGLEAGEAGALLAFGSGSTKKRERLVLATPGGAVRVLDAQRVYAAMRACEAFSGSELNLEGVARSPHDAARLVLVQRGNGAANDRGLAPRDATAEISLPALLAHLRDPEGAPAPSLERVVPYALGAIEDARLTFTDAVSAHGALFFLAAAEASPNAVDDGPVRGVALGVFAPEGSPGPARWARIYDARGAPVLDKAEGLAPHPTDPRRFYAVIDRDEPESPAELLELELEGPWLTTGG